MNTSSDEIFDAPSEQQNKEHQHEEEERSEGEDSESSKSFTSKSTVIECICNGRYNERSNQTISCDMCKKWFHRICSGLLVRQWKFFNDNPSFDWFCKFCKEQMDTENRNPDLQKIRE